MAQGFGAQGFGAQGFKAQAFKALLAGAALTLASAAGASARDFTAEQARMAHPTPGDVIVIAHRACWRETAENSVAAVEACAALGVDGVEFDVRHTRDGVAVVMHDETVDRMTDGHGEVSDLTLAEFKALRLRQGRGGPGAPLTGLHPPTLAEYLAAAKDRLWLVFDVKDGTQGEAFQAAEAAGVRAQAIFFYECESGLLRDKVQPFWNEVVVFPITFGRDRPLAKAEAACPSHPANLVHAKWSAAGYLQAGAQVSRRREERLWTATMFPDDNAGDDDDRALADPAAVWGRQIAAGANMIMTNRPKALLDYLKAGR